MKQNAFYLSIGNRKLTADRFLKPTKCRGVSHTPISSCTDVCDTTLHQKCQKIIKSKPIGEVVSV
jgi:hypothetical protein